MIVLLLRALLGGGLRGSLPSLFFARSCSLQSAEPCVE